ncbi:conserved hypothetical protein [Histoplasma capsulatum G186AR]|uniref:Methyltransferase domain-containing protein n=1 Tax=Ajellomyces capsulatus (strain G186AR / H82 / ATCC MYA-2454 / RMSCC 2432) TaxID=447093 RepID=C0NTE5_AJECG|nr:uncharacterized protein HCBG_06425 [Histoplasma capsulatum G186AR]EEH05306.1 conserved hypothetical protein [Histoplasma capsulatum G186AR]
MRPETPLPLPACWPDADTYISSLLSFITTSTIFRNLCGGVHILDFLTRIPDLYTTVLPQEWRDFFVHHDIGVILDLLMREDIDALLRNITGPANSHGDDFGGCWRGAPVLPPESLLRYINDVRRHCLQREFPRLPIPISNTSNSQPSNNNNDHNNHKHNNGNHDTIPQHIAIGMKPKKAHEVAHFARYVDALSDYIQQQAGGAEDISHIVDFGSGQNYLGRTLASPLYNRQIIAIERRQNNISGAIGKDVLAKLKKNKTKKKNQGKKENASGDVEVAAESDSAVSTSRNGEEVRVEDGKEGVIDLDMGGCVGRNNGRTAYNAVVKERHGYKGSMDYIEHDIQNGYLEAIVRHVVEPSSPPSPNGQNPQSQRACKYPDSPPVSESNTKPARVMVISLHSCGNLVHHGIRSLILNPSVTAIAMIGCCYNLMTERLGPVTYKLPILRSLHPRLEATSNAYDPHGFPMSKKLETYRHEGGTGIKLNITARMMAVQAPYNWGPKDSETFFTRHFYRALLQRVLVDYGVVPVPGIGGPIGDVPLEGGGKAEEVASGTPLIVGSMRKAAFVSFAAYAHAAIEKLSRDAHYGGAIQEKGYEARYAVYRKNLSIVWSLMAFSAGVVESVIVVDRWLFLREQTEVKEAWVEAVFDYQQSPRNLVVVGIKG